MTDRFDVIVVGAGPAGLAAAHAASTHGMRVALIDAQPRPGGQVWRHDIDRSAPRAARRAIRAATQGIEWLTRTTVVGAEPQQLLIETPDDARELRYEKLIVATGARELLLPFPGWTLPGVTGAGGMQALTKQGWPVAGKRIVVAGSGPLLLAAAATLRAHGAKVLGIHEQASWSSTAAFASRLLLWPARLAQAVELRARLARVPYHCGSRVIAAYGDTALRTVEVDSPRGVQRIDCDHLAIGYGLIPNMELVTLLGCEQVETSQHPYVKVDAMMQTSVPGVYAAGETCGIGGLAVARLEGAMAGHAAAGAHAAANALRSKQRGARRFSVLLNRYFALDQQLREQPAPQTVICRCEDVTMAALQGHADIRTAKLVTRCGMGACQGRICGGILNELALFSSGHSGRPPVFPTRLATLARAGDPLSPDEH